MILLTGPTGTVGTELAKPLAARRVPFRAMVRSPEAAKPVAALAGAEIVVGNFDDAATLTRALAGVDRAFLLTNSSERAEAQQSAFVDAARRAGVPHLVKLSQLGADPGSPVRFLRYHAAGEHAIQASGMAYTFLRPNLFMQSLLDYRRSVVVEDRFLALAGDAKIGVVDVRDIAAVGTAALTTHGHEGQIYEVTGPEALTHTDMAERLSEALGRCIEYLDSSPDGMRGSLVSAGFLTSWQADGLLEDYARYRRGEAAAIASGVQDATGQAPRNFADFARDYAPAFSRRILP